jgi:penicillin-binding protein 1A
MRLFGYKKSIKKTISPLDSIAYYQRFLNTGLVSVEPATGYVRAWVGGIDHEFFKYDHVRSTRQVGSTFKPIVYAAALEEGIEPCTYFSNKQVNYTEYENWTPRNADGRYGGEYSMRGALAYSVNTVSARIIVQTGIEPTITLARRMGIKSELPKVPALALGVADVSLLEMVSAYTSFANLGKRVEPTYVYQITDKNGKVIRQHKPGQPAQVMSGENAALMVKMMQAVIEEGSGTRLRSEFGLPMDIAGKTGTTQDQTDGWFIGFTPELVTGVWVGAESPVVRFRTLALGQGSNTALPIWGEFMKRLVQMKDFSDYRTSRFQPLPVEWQNRLACSSFIEEPQKENVLARIIQDIFPSRTPEEKNERKKERQERKLERRKRREEERKKRRGN